MVRVLFPFAWEGEGEWIGKYMTTKAMVGVGTEESVNHIQTQFPLICRKTHKTHSLGVFYGENPLESTFLVILFQIVFVIFTISIIRLLLKPLKQPRVISEIIVSRT